MGADLRPADAWAQASAPAIGLHAFMREAWPVVEPATPFIDGPHIHAICEHLEACSRGDIRKLVINIPPRCEKSLLIAVFWFCWTWTHRPETRWLYASYAEQLAIRDSLKCRRIIQSPWYRARFGRSFRLTGDQNQKTRFENDRTGYRLATGVGGVGTGEGGDFVIVDDPHKVQEAESEPVREAAVTWWLETMSSRGNDPDRAVWVIVMQRVHHADLTGEVLARELGYEHLCLPMRYEDTPEAQARVTSIGFRDWRERDGELLWPERFNEAAVTDLERAMGPYAAAGQLQQRPSPRGGQFFRRAWFPVVAAAPVEARRVRYWDKAGTADGGDYSAGVRMACTPDGIYYVEHVVRGRWSPFERNQVMQQVAAADAAECGNAVTIWMEEEGGSSGKESSQLSIRQLAGYPVRADRPTGDKQVRARPLADQAEAGNVRLVAGPWMEPFLEELERFPKGHDDQVDAAAGAFNKLALVRVWTAY